MFRREHHRHVAQALSALDGEVLREHHCHFGGGTAIALRFGEYRESVDIDFLVSDLPSYRGLRNLLAGTHGLEPLFKSGQQLVRQNREVRADQYGIRSMLGVAGASIKFEIVLEGRIVLDAPRKTDAICGVATLTVLDMATSKLLANSDRWRDEAVFSRDLIDLAMMQPRLPLLRAAVAKAEGAYGKAIRADLGKAIDRIQQQRGWLERCMTVMAIDAPRAELWQRIRALRRVLARPDPAAV